MCAAVDHETIAKHSNANKQVVFDHILSKCTEDNEFEDFRTMASFLKASDENKLEIKVLTGGLANFSYQIFTSDGSTMKIYAKLTFGHMQLFPDTPCPLVRTENEFKMMKMFNEMTPGSVAKPYFCDDVGGTGKNGDATPPMKLLVAQWSKADEQFGNQFIDGVVDLR